jgi:hypothetical protein
MSGLNKSHAREISKLLATALVIRLCVEEPKNQRNPTTYYFEVIGETENKELFCLTAKYYGADSIAKSNPAPDFYIQRLVPENRIEALTNVLDSWSSFPLRQNWANSHANYYFFADAEGKCTVLDYLGYKSHAVVYAIWAEAQKRLGALQFVSLNLDFNNRAELNRLEILTTRLKAFLQKVEENLDGAIKTIRSA